MNAENQPQIYLDLFLEVLISNLTVLDVPLAQARLHQSSEELAASGDSAHSRLL